MGCAKCARNEVVIVTSTVLLSTCATFIRGPKTPETRSGRTGMRSTVCRSHWSIGASRSAFADRASVRSYPLPLRPRGVPNPAPSFPSTRTSVFACNVPRARSGVPHVVSSRGLPTARDPPSADRRRRARFVSHAFFCFPCGDSSACAPLEEGSAVASASAGRLSRPRTASISRRRSLALVTSSPPIRSASGDSRGEEGDGSFVSAGTAAPSARSSRGRSAAPQLGVSSSRSGIAAGARARLAARACQEAPDDVPREPPNDHVGRLPKRKDGRRQIADHARVQRAR